MAAELNDLLGVLTSLNDKIDKIEKGQKKHQKKVNSELRKAKLERGGDAKSDGKSPKGSKAADTPKSEKKSRRAAEAKALEDAISERLSKLTPEAREKFEKENAGRTAVDRVIAAAKLHGETPEKPTAAPPSPTTPPLARGPGPANVQTGAHPRSMAEFYSMSQEQRAQLMADDSFDPSGLPVQARA